MTNEGVLLVIVGLAAGFALGHAHAWRFARKLEHHRVRLVDWDQSFDAHAEVHGGCDQGRAGMKNDVMFSSTLDEWATPAETR
jgi:hypothetical protein